MECRHIIPEASGGNDDLENCIPLCLDCHVDVGSYNPDHPKGTKYRPEELRQHRDRWYQKAEGATVSTYNEQHLKLDQKVFERLLAMLPWQGPMDFLSQHNFGWSFDLNELDPIHTFIYHSDDPTLEFIDPTLEAIRATLVCSLNDLSSLLSVNTWTLGFSPTRSKVPDEWVTTQPERYEKVLAEIHSLAALAVDTYRSLIREARHRLALETPER